jgi:hypothetical protein
MTFNFWKLFLPIREHVRSFHLLVSFSVYVFQVSCFHFRGLLSTQFSLYLGILFFEVIVNGIVLQFLSWSCSLLVYRKTTSFCTIDTFFSMIGFWTQGFVLAIQTLRHLNHDSSPFFSGSYGDRISLFA